MNRIDLGIAIAHATTKPGQRRSLREIAAYCDCVYANIWLIEQTALHKLRKRLFMRDDPELRELAEEARAIFSERCRKE